MERTAFVSKRADLLIGLFVLAAGYLIGSSYHQAFRATGEQENFGQYTFAAAVSLACGNGFYDIGSTITPALDDFLNLRRDAFECGALPSSLPKRQPDLTQGLYRYLMTAVALVWMAKGMVTWGSLSPLFGLAYGLTLVAAYAIFRAGMGRALALLMTTACAVSAIHLGHLPYLRDYLKAPFILGLIAVMAHLSVGPFERRRVLALACLCGAILGVGFGFRNDILINILPWTVVLFAGGRDPIAADLRLKATALALSMAIFAVLGWPILQAYARGSNTGHVALLGLFTYFDAPLGVASSVYEWGYGYSDSLVSTIVNSYTNRTAGHPIAYLSAEYDAAMFEYIAAIVRRWPADVIARGWGSVLAVLASPFTTGVHISSIPKGLEQSWAAGPYRFHDAVLRLLDGWSTVLVVLSLSWLAVRRLRQTMVLLLLVIYFAGYPAVQFSVRHFFHLEFIPWFAIGFLITEAARAVREPGKWLAGVSHPARPAMTFLALLAGLVVVPLSLARAYQSPTVASTLADRYVAAPREDLPQQHDALGNGRVFISLPSLWQDRSPSQAVNAAYIVAEFSSRQCDADVVVPVFRYAARSEATDFSHAVVVKVRPGGSPTQVFFPAYHSVGWTEFSGIELPAADAGCLMAVSRVKRANLPALLIGLNLPPEWRNGRLYQTLRGYETQDDGAGPAVNFITAPYGTPAPSLAGLAAVARVDASPIVHDQGTELLVDGRPPSTYAHLIRYEERHVERLSHAVIRGDLRRGGLTVGIQKAGQWTDTVNLTAVGPFVVTLRAPTEGSYAIAVTDYSRPRWLRETFPVLSGYIPRFLAPPRRVDVTVSAAGWVPPS